MKYIYTRKNTYGTTGYVQCRPDQLLSFQDALALLEQRPRDTFLHKYILELILAADAHASFIEQAHNSPLLAALLLEAHRLGVQNIPVKQISLLASPITPDFYLSIAQERDAAAANIHEHKTIPSGFSSKWSKEEINREKHRLANRKQVLPALFNSAPKTGCSGQTDGKSLIAAAQTALENAAIEVGPEMRHESSLSPIALLRTFQINSGTASGSVAHHLTGSATAYGRGLKLDHARIGCLMEIIERVSAHMLLEPCNYYFDTQAGIGKDRSIRPGLPDSVPDYPLHWMEALTASGESTLIPCQAVYLFTNLDEAAIYDHIGSTGLGAGASATEAKLSALLEVLERDAHATMPFVHANCFELYSNDPIISGLLADYRWRGIRIQFQDITTELGVPCYRCFVEDKSGKIAQATAASLSGKRAAISALTETPWPYSWANPVPAPSGTGLPNLPAFLLEGLPDYALGTPGESLNLLEHTLMACGLMPVYVNLTRPDLGIPVYRAFVTGLENDAELEHGPSLRFMSHL